MKESEIRELARITAVDVAKNAGVAEQLCFPHIYLNLKGSLTAPDPVREQLAAALRKMVNVWEEGGIATYPIGEARAAIAAAYSR